MSSTNDLFPTPPQLDRLAQRLRRLYGDQGPALAAELGTLIAAFRHRHASPPARCWDETDAVLITYGDQIFRPPESPLAVLQQFCAAERWDELVSTLHLLPFFPSSSDDGFSVVDYQAVDPALGTWNDVAALDRSFRLMFDLVLNHASQHSAWFQDFLAGKSPCDRFFCTADPSADLSQVVRPRSSPLLTPVETADGVRFVWTTFSADQVDLNYAEPQLLRAMLAVLLDYVARGAQIVRLDAIAFLWKEIGTSCLHLPQTHEVVKLCREVLSLAAPHVWLLTETNVPHEENISYFGQGDEAHLVYQFALPPLLLDAFAHGDAQYLSAWVESLEPPLPGTSYLNFTASHDGIGVRPLEGLLPSERFASLIAKMQSRGALVSTRRRQAEDVPYELNITYVDALAPDDEDPALHVRRFLASQAMMLALQGIPAIYFPSLIGSRNDAAGTDESGIARRINRRKLSWDELTSQVAPGSGLSADIYQGYRRLLQIRRALPAFHPDVPQETLPVDKAGMFAIQRGVAAGGPMVVAAVNVARVPTVAALGSGNAYDWLAAEVVPLEATPFAPGQARWLDPAAVANVPASLPSS